MIFSHKFSKGSDVSTYDNQMEKVERPSHYGPAEAATVIFTWLIGFAMIALIIQNYKGDQSVSLENSIGYVVIGIVLVDTMVLFRDSIAEWIRTRNND